MASKKMPADGLPVIARFEVRHRYSLGQTARNNRSVLAFASNADLLVSLYRGMVLPRASI